MATTWQRGSRRKFGVHLIAMVPKPMLATVIRSDGAGRPPLPMAVAGMIVGKPSAAADAAMKRR